MRGSSLRRQLFRRRLRGEHPLCRLQVDQRIGVEMRGNDVGPLVQDLMQGLIAWHVEDGDRAAPGAGVDVPAHPARLVLGHPWPERLPTLREIGRPLWPWRRNDEK